MTAKIGSEGIDKSTVEKSSPNKSLINIERGVKKTVINSKSLMLKKAYQRINKKKGITKA
jgi:hypothetical protein